MSNKTRADLRNIAVSVLTACLIGGFMFYVGTTSTDARQDQQINELQKSQDEMGPKLDKALEGIEYIRGRIDAMANRP